MATDMTSILTLDLGTSSARAALVDESGQIRCMHAVPLTATYPRHGWVEQRPADWWHAIKRCIALLLKDPAADGRSIAAVCCCGQMHAAIALQENGSPVFESIALWNDKRARQMVDAFANGPNADKFRDIASNPETAAWPAFKIAWYRQKFPDQITDKTQFLLPKDYINLKLTGEKAIDRTEAGSSFLMETRTERWSTTLLKAFGISQSQLPQIVGPHTHLGTVTADAASQTGLQKGLPVIVGAGDYPAALLGSGMIRAGQVSDITGTSFLLTALGEKPFASSKTMNVADTGNMWGAFSVVDAAGDSIRWSRHFLNDGQKPYADILQSARLVPPGCDDLLYLPYLTGERFGHGTGLTANILNLTASHTSAHLHRAVMEGVAFAMRHNARVLFDSGLIPGEIICAGGGSRATLWNEIKATVFDRPMKPTAEPEAGLIGTACLAFAALEAEANPYSIAEKMVRYGPATDPKIEDSARYHECFEAFSEARSMILRKNGEI